MKKMKRARTRLSDNTRGLLLGIGGAIGVSLALLLLTAKLILSGTLPEDAVQVYGLVLLTLGSFAGALLAAALTKQRKLPYALLTSACFTAVLVLIHLCMFNGKFRMLPAALGLGIGAGLAAGVLARTKKKRRFG